MYYAAFCSSRKYHMYEFPSRKFCLVHLPAHICYSETHRFQQHDDNSDFATLTSAMAAAAHELIRLIVILQQKMVRNIAEVW